MSTSTINFTRAFLITMAIGGALLLAPRAIHAQTPSSISTALGNSIGLSKLTQSSVTITWQSSDPTTTLVWFRKASGSNTGTYQASLNASTQRSKGVYRNDHTIKLTNLESNTQYIFTVGGINTSGVTNASIERMFTTGSTSNSSSSAPAITTFNVSNISANKAILNVTTNEPVTVQVSYNVRGVSDTSMVQSSSVSSNHEIPLNNLSSNTNYQARITVTDRDEKSTTSDTISWTTSTTGSDIALPIVTNVQVTNLDSTTTRITWNTNEPTTSIVWYKQSTTPGLLSFLNSDAKTQNDSQDYTTSHSVVINNLDTGRTYTYRVGGSDKSNNVGQSDEMSFVAQSGTTNTSNASRPVIYNTTVTISQNSRTATLRWHTNENSIDTILYSTSPDFMNSTTKTATHGKSSKNHSLRIANMNRDTFYYYKITNRDNDGNDSLPETGILYVAR